MVRFLDLDAGRLEAEARARAEVSLLSCSRCPQLLRYFCSFTDGPRLWVVTELARGGTVLQAMTHEGGIRSSARRDVQGGGNEGEGGDMGTKDNCFDEDETYVQPLRDLEVAAILREVLLGLSYLHRSGTLHRDIRCGNVYLSTAACDDGGGEGKEVGCVRLGGLGRGARLR